mmetsp:Transcript_17351/g.25344  ORF Transcript_17351/g.25344 Transcript_17351/m.25344 type:complete len:146 (-) Transcript_17351:447-884(-)|eukprot:CAMPEP_0113951532 /NCGR_PEP_ID=MMETSP1339-20121228/86632_1 /TAXON_ID=94617 /ORGANISM="Fibrocapsa japonica" /LENGTH=145 /DNA_ID=CAMNT_0000959825 /DNA_START=18 /DNA_END=455 /DNA_ORIENTATION=- /assembly_acc=CAM_ASM_000762
MTNDTPAENLARLFKEATMRNGAPFQNLLSFQSGASGRDWLQSDQAPQAALDSIEALRKSYVEGESSSYSAQDAAFTVGDAAACLGHLKVLEAVQDNRTRKATNRAMALAAGHGHCNILEYLISMALKSGTTGGASSTQEPSPQG